MSVSTLSGHFLLADASSPELEAADSPSGAALGLSAPMIEREGTLAAALTGRPRIEDQPFRPEEIARNVIALYREHGPRFLSRLRGPFALALVDTESRRALLAVDRVGFETLCWGAGRTGVAFATSPAQVARTLTERPQLNRQALFDFMIGHVVAGPETAYSGVRKLSPGSYVEIEGGQMRVRRFWEPDYGRASMSDVAALQREVMPTIDRAIERSAATDRTGTFLSGGLDSSTVTGLFTKRRGPSASAFSVSFGVQEFDELRFARAAAERFGCRHEVYEVVAEDIVDSIPRIAAAYDEPFGNSSAVPVFCCARVASERGMDHLLAGDGGDELFGGNERYVRHQTFELYARLPLWLRRSVADPLAARLDPETSPLPLRKLSSYVRQANVPLPERFETWNMIYREGAARVFDPDFLDSVDPDGPFRRMREVWQSCPSDDLLDRMLWYDWKYTLADNDLRKVGRMCELAGIRVSYPLLDEELIDLSLKIPSAAKIAGTRLRAFFKDAVQSLLPREIIDKKKHGFGLPFGVWLKTHSDLQDLVYSTLASLGNRHILQGSFIDRVLNEHRDGEASYYGSAVWDMVMLEQWLLQHELKP